jgi:hypothetical protein
MKSKTTTSVIALALGQAIKPVRLYSVHSVQCTHRTMYNVHTVQCKMYTPYNVHTVQCTMYTLYNVQCTHCTNQLLETSSAVLCTHTVKLNCSPKWKQLLLPGWT